MAGFSSVMSERERADWSIRDGKNGPSPGNKDLKVQETDHRRLFLQTEKEKQSFPILYGFISPFHYII